MDTYESKRHRHLETENKFKDKVRHTRKTCNLSLGISLNILKYKVLGMRFSK